jgi:hypothetical protein
MTTNTNSGLGCSLAGDWDMSAAWTTISVATTVALLAGAYAVIPAHREANGVRFAAPRPEPTLERRHQAEDARRREEALQRARFWKRTDPASANLGANPPDQSGALARDTVVCRYLAREESGTTQKFRCSLEDGEVVKVKYGHTREVPAEVAATRLVSALGFGADRMYLVPRVRCYGCPRHPFQVMKVAAWAGWQRSLADSLSEDRYTDFRWAAVERHMEGVEISVGESDGWSWHELMDEAWSPEQRTELDALRLVAKFVAHWDNKAENQRLVCVGQKDAERSCSASLAFIQDLGSTFGPEKADLEGWESTSIWADRSTCLVSMRELPYSGATFVDVRISEPGRQLAASQLQALGHEQIEALFRGARFAEFHRFGRSSRTEEWVRVFKAKVQEIAAGAACQS